jgi:hypothetical protein
MMRVFHGERDSRRGIKTAVREGTRQGAPGHQHRGVASVRRPLCFRNLDNAAHAGVLNGRPVLGLDLWPYFFCPLSDLFQNDTALVKGPDSQAPPLISFFLGKMDAACPLCKAKYPPDWPS